MYSCLTNLVTSPPKKKKKLAYISKILKIKINRKQHREAAPNTLEIGILDWARGSELVFGNL